MKCQELDLLCSRPYASPGPVPPGVGSRSVPRERCGPAASVAVNFAQNQAGDRHLLVETVGYLHRILPRLGDGIGRGHGAYGYLARTIADFPEAELLAGHTRDNGFAACDWTRLTGGIVAIHTAIKKG